MINTIDEEATFKQFGYISKYLKPNSNKKIIAICDNPDCRKIRILSFQGYCKLCHKCACQTDEYREKQRIGSTGKFPSIITREKMSNAQSGENNPNYGKNFSGKNSPNYGKKRSSETIKKMCVAQQKHWENPLECKKASEATIKYFENPLSHEKASKGQIKRWEDPLEHERASAGQQGISYDEWEGFVSNLPYCPAFNEECKELNREKYGRKCFLTGLAEEENITSKGKQQKLSVHHVDMNKMQGCNGIRWKLVPICLKWHKIAHTKLWKARIIWLLNNIWN